MNFDLDATLEEMMVAATAAFGRRSGRVEETLRRVLDDQKETLRRIAAARIEGDLDDDELRRQIANSRLVFEAGLSMVRAVGKATIQKALDAAFGVLLQSIDRSIAAG